MKYHIIEVHDDIEVETGKQYNKEKIDEQLENAVVNAWSNNLDVNEIDVRSIPCVGKDNCHICNLDKIVLPKEKWVRV